MEVAIRATTTRTVTLTVTLTTIRPAHPIPTIVHTIRTVVTARMDPTRMDTPTQEAIAILQATTTTTTTTITTLTATMETATVGTTATGKTIP